MKRLTNRGDADEHGLIVKLRGGRRSRSTPDAGPGGAIAEAAQAGIVLRPRSPTQGALTRTFAEFLASG